jgi:hypothetical protein
MAGNLADQMIRKRERELKKRHGRHVLMAFAAGCLLGMGVTVALVGPRVEESRLLNTALDLQNGQMRDCREELDYWRHSAPRRGGLDWSRCMWALEGCSRERDQLYEDLDRYERMTGYTYEYDPFNRYFLYDWQGVDPADL